MPKHPADGPKEDLPGLYRKMEELMARQLDLLAGSSEGPDDEKMEALVRISGEWQEYARKLSERQSELKRLPESRRQEVAETLKRMNEYGRKLEEEIRHRMNTLTWSLRALHHHAAASKAYGGYGNQDVVPMFFDERQ